MPQQTPTGVHSDEDHIQLRSSHYGENLMTKWGNPKSTSTELNLKKLQETFSEKAGHPNERTHTGWGGSVL